MLDYIFIDQNIEQLKKEIYTVKRPVFNRLVEQCKLYFNEQIPDEHPKSSTTFMGMAMANLSLAYILTEQEHYLEEAKRWIFKTVNYPHWGNAHLVDVDLSAAWILFGLGISFNWLENVLSPEEHKAIKDKLVLQGERMYDFKIKTEGSGWSTNYFQNHNWINLTGLSAAGYAIKHLYPEAQAWIDVSKSNFDTVYSMLPEDGSDYEGVVYWRYGAMWLFVYAHLLKERENINYFESCKFLEHTFDYRLYQAAPNLEEQINFGDCHDRRSGHSTAIYYKVASEYNNGYAQNLGNLVRDEFLYREAYESKVKPGILPECFFEVLFFNPEVKSLPFDSLPREKYFPDLGLYVHKSSWERDANHMSFKCGHPGGKTQWQHLWRLKEEGYNCFGLSHQHPDNNSFILVSDETYLAIDDGYNRHVKASDHNTIMIDGIGYEDEGQNNIWKNYSKDMIAEIEHIDMNDDYTYMIGETAKQYDKTLSLDSFKRRLIHTDSGYYILLDTLASEKAHTYTWMMYADHYPTSKDGHHSYKNGFSNLDLYHYSTASTECDFVDNNVRAVMTTQEPDKFTENKMKGLHISNTCPVEKIGYMTVLIPKTIEHEVTHFNVESGIGVTVTVNNKSETYIYSQAGSFPYNNKTYKKHLVLFKEGKEFELE